MPRDNFTMSESSGSFGMQQRQDRFDAIGDLIVGPPGPPGPQGPPGEDGKSAYQSAVDGGYQGTETEFNNELSDIQYAASLARDAADDAEAAAEHYPKIQNGTWWVWDVEREYFVDTGISAQGPKGDAGPGVPAGGTTGQVLAKKSNADNDTEWVNQSGGGTADALPLAGGTMTGAIDMGSNRITNLPTPTNYLDAANKNYVDKRYIKPANGIPKSDLASAVQTSLGKADTALQSVPSTYRTAAAQDAIDAAQDAQIESISRRNLLDNWYFVGGGSQLGYGTFPINQRGQTSYTTAGYGVDRWKAASAAISCTVNSGAVTIKSTSASAQWYQILSNQSELVGKQVTLSALTTAGLIQTTVDIPSTIPSGTSTIGTGSGDINGYSIYIRAISGKLSAVVYAGSTFTSAGISIVAMKLEIGGNQTLAHNEGTESSPNWVLNEIPDYSEELNKCLMYFERLKGPYVGFATGYSTNTSNAYVCGKVNPKVKAPSITLSGTIYLQSANHAGSDSSASTSLASVYALPSGNFSFICQSSNMVQGEFNQAQFRDTTSYLDFSAE